MKCNLTGAVFIVFASRRRLGAEFPVESYERDLIKLRNWAESNGLEIVDFRQKARIV